MPAPLDSGIGPSPLLASLFPSGIVTMATRAPGDPALLSAAEAVHIRRAQGKRAGEFAAGRLCARRALAQLDRHGWDLIAGPDRAPVWPSGIVGSISHTAGYCGVAVAELHRFRSVGLDVENDGRVTSDLYPLILTETECRSVSAAATWTSDTQATLIFSAKEAFYKCQYPLTSAWLEFGDIEVDLPRAMTDAGIIALRPSRRLEIEGRFPAPWYGRFAISEGLVMTGFAFREAGWL